MNGSVHTICPHCRTVNRVPLSRLGEHPRCGSCRGALFDGKPMELTSAELYRHLEREELPLLVDFWAPWCSPCRAMAPQFQQAAGVLEPRLRLARVNTETEGEAAGRMGIRSIPTLVLFRGGREVARQVGAMGSENIVWWVTTHLR